MREKNEKETAKSCRLVVKPQFSRKTRKPFMNVADIISICRLHGFDVLVRITIVAKPVLLVSIIIGNEPGEAGTDRTETSSITKPKNASPIGKPGTAVRTNDSLELVLSGEACRPPLVVVLDVRVKLADIQNCGVVLVLFGLACFDNLRNGAIFRIEFDDSVRSNAVLVVLLVQHAMQVVVRIQSELVDDPAHDVINVVTRNNFVDVRQEIIELSSGEPVEHANKDTVLDAARIVLAEPSVLEPVVSSVVDAITDGLCRLHDIEPVDISSNNSIGHPTADIDACDLVVLVLGPGREHTTKILFLVVHVFLSVLRDRGT